VETSFFSDLSFLELSFDYFLLSDSFYSFGSKLFLSILSSNLSYAFGFSYGF
jgi:hypothetical protein